ncbi:MAG: AMP-binding protein [Bacteroidota bacterium]
MDLLNHIGKDIFNEAFHQKGNKIFVDFGDRKLSYGAFRTELRKYTTYFRNEGLTAGQRVVISSRDEYFICCFYLSLIANGITVILLDPDSGTERAKAIVNHTKASFLFLDAEIQELWEIPVDQDIRVIPIQQATAANVFRKLLQKGKSQNILFPQCVERLAESDFIPPEDPESDAYILYTSGTTSAPKGVRISYRALLSHLDSLSRVYQMDHDSKIFNNLILSHADGIVQGPLLALYNAGTLYRPFPFSIQNIEDAFDIIYREKINYWIMVPTMMALIYQFKKDDKDCLDQAGFRNVISCGAKLDAVLWKQFGEKFNTRIINVYGLTETVTGGIYAGHDDKSNIIGSIGNAVDCDIRISGIHDEEMGINETGELWIRGSLLMSGYLDAPEANQEVFEGAWLKTGDIGYLGEDGCYRLTGRKKLIIISGGVNIFPEEVSEIIRTHPAVQDAVTFGIEDGIWGEIVAAALVIRENIKLSNEEIVAFCREHMEEQKVPSRVYFLEALPYGRSGKVQMQLLREKVLQTADNGVSEAEPVQTFLQIVSKILQLPLHDLNMDLRFDNSRAWDSISHLMLVVAMEKHYQIEFTALEVMNVKSLADLFSIIKGKQFEAN